MVATIEIICAKVNHHALTNAILHDIYEKHEQVPLLSAVVRKDPNTATVLDCTELDDVDYVRIKEHFENTDTFYDDNRVISFTGPPV